jgi:hypothetical protein
MSASAAAFINNLLGQAIAQNVIRCAKLPCVHLALAHFLGSTGYQPVVRGSLPQTDGNLP